MNLYRTINLTGLGLNLFFTGLFIFFLFFVITDEHGNNNSDMMIFLSIIIIGITMSISLIYYYYRNISFTPLKFKSNAFENESLVDIIDCLKPTIINEPIHEFHPIKIWSFIFSSIHLILGCFFLFNFIKKSNYDDIGFYDYFWLVIVTFIFFLFSGIAYFITFFMIRSLKKV